MTNFCLLSFKNRACVVFYWTKGETENKTDASAWKKLFYLANTGN